MRRNKKLALRSFVKRVLNQPLFRPTRFYSDWSGKTGITHYHKILHDFLTQGEGQPFLILDLGCGNRRLPGRTVGLDIAFYAGVDVLGDAHTLPFKSEVFDRVVIQEVLEHVRDPERVLAEIWRVLKPGGKVYVEVPLIYPIHDKVDFWRFTPMGLDSLCQRYFLHQSSGVVMGGGSAVSVVVRTYFALVFSRGQEGTLYNLGWLMGGLLTFWLKYVDEKLKLQKAPLMERLAAGHCWIGEKRLWSPR